MSIAHRQQNIRNDMCAILNNQDSCKIGPPKMKIGHKNALASIFLAQLFENLIIQGSSHII